MDDSGVLFGAQFYRFFTVKYFFHLFTFFVYDQLG